MLSKSLDRWRWRSPDLNPADNFVWGLMYETKVDTRPTALDRVFIAAEDKRNRHKTISVATELLMMHTEKCMDVKCACQDCIQNLVGKYLFKQVSVEKDHVEMDIEDVGCEGVDWINVVQGRDQSIQNTVMIFRVTLRVGNFLIS